MSTGTTVRESILSNLVTVCKAISADNSFRTNVRLVERQWRHPDEIAHGDFPALFIIDSDEQVSELTNAALLSTFTVVIVGYVRHEKAASVEINKLIGDVIEKIYADKTRGGYAVNTVIRRIETDVFNELPYAFCAVSFDIEYSYLALDVTQPT